MREDELLANVLAAAAAAGVLAFHCGDSRRAKGNPGFPDLVLVGELVAFVELKTEMGYLDHEQREWTRRLGSSRSAYEPESGEPGVLVELWRPHMWPDEIMARLRAIRGE